MRDVTEADLPKLRASFEMEYTRQFSRTVPAMLIEVLNWGVSVSSRVPTPPTIGTPPDMGATDCVEHRRITCDLSGATIEVAVFERSGLPPGTRLSGPALIVEPQTTTLVSRDFHVHVDGADNLWLTQLAGEGT